MVMQMVGWKMERGSDCVPQRCDVRGSAGATGGEERRVLAWKGVRSEELGTVDRLARGPAESPE